VRKCAANALPKLLRQPSSDMSNDPTASSALKAQLQEIVSRLLFSDSSTMVLGSAVQAFNEICGSSYHLLHTSYRKLCHLLADMDEWAQISTLNTLAFYARLNFKKPTIGQAEVIDNEKRKARATTVTLPDRTKPRRKVRPSSTSCARRASEASAEKEVHFCGGSGRAMGLEGARRRRCSSAAGAGERWGRRGRRTTIALLRQERGRISGCRGETPRTPPAAGEVARLPHF
jgi:hypothetical protein